MPWLRTITSRISGRNLPPVFVRFPGSSGQELVNRLVDSVCSLIQSFEEQYASLERVVLAVPGIVTGHGILKSAPPLWGNLISDVPLQAAIQARTRLKVVVFNDLCGPAVFYGGFQPMRMGPNC